MIPTTEKTVPLAMKFKQNRKVQNTFTFDLDPLSTKNIFPKSSNIQNFMPNSFNFYILKKY